VGPGRQHWKPRAEGGSASARYPALQRYSPSGRHGQSLNNTEELFTIASWLVSRKDILDSTLRVSHGRGRPAPSVRSAKDDPNTSPGRQPCFTRGARVTVTFELLNHARGCRAGSAAGGVAELASKSSRFRVAIHGVRTQARRSRPRTNRASSSRAVPGVAPYVAG